MRGVAALRGPPQAAVVEHRVPRLGPLRGQRRERGVLPHRHHADPPEPADVAELEHPAVVERPPRPHVRIELTGTQAQHARSSRGGRRARGRRRATSSRYLPRRPTASMRAPAANGADANFGDGCPHASVIERARDQRLQLPPHRLDLRQLRHRHGHAAVPSLRSSSARRSMRRPSCQVPSAASFVLAQDADRLEAELRVGGDRPAVGGVRDRS